MSIKQTISPKVQKIIDRLNEQIADHERAITDLKFNIKVWLENDAPQEVKLMLPNSPLTRDLIRNFLKGYRQPVQTIRVIDLLYNNKSEEERNKLIKTLSVIFNQMEKEGEIVIEKRSGVKGNFYTLKK
jgi:hypothetical protein